MSETKDVVQPGADIESRVISYIRWCSELTTLRTRYGQAEPFPHIVFDHFLVNAVAEQALAEFPPINSPGWIHQKHINENKLGHPNRSSFGPMIGAIIDELNSPSFLRFLWDLTGIHGLLPDVTLQGAACISLSAVDS